MAIADLGPTQLKNIERPIRVYSLEVGKPAQAKPETAAKSAQWLREPKRKSTRLTLVAAGIAALLLLVAAGAWYFLAANRFAPVAYKATAEAARLSIVVLPFANLSGDPAQDYLADALTDQLTTAIARLRDSSLSRTPQLLPTRARRSTPRPSARSWGCAMCWRARCNRPAIR